jgi:PhzF family phenazine biosynthesis protein
MSNSKQIEVHIINAFVDNDKGGNQAGVVLNADDLSNEDKLNVAAKVGLSETAFVSKSDTAEFKLDFFTPTRQIAHCGHATVAAFSYLAQVGEIKTAYSSKETIDGNRDILLQGDLAFMEQKAPIYTDIDKEKVLKSLNATENDLLKDAPIQIVNTGNSFVIIPVKEQNILKNIQPNFDLIRQISEESDLVGYYVFCTEVGNPERDSNTRMFAPRYGIEEESATGMAAGPLACYLYAVLGQKKERFMIEQGWFMKEPSKSLIIADLILENGTITKLMAGGKGISKASITMDI